MEDRIQESQAFALSISIVAAVVSMLVVGVVAHTLVKTITSPLKSLRSIARIITGDPLGRVHGVDADAVPGKVVGGAPVFDRMPRTLRNRDLFPNKDTCLCFG